MLARPYRLRQITFAAAALATLAISSAALGQTAQKQIMVVPAPGTPDVPAQTDSPETPLRLSIREGTNLKAGTYITVEVVSPIDGLLVVYALTPSGMASQLYPSKAFPAPDPEPDLAHVKAGQTLTIPSGAQLSEGYRIILRPPTGESKLKAFVAKDKVEIADIIRTGFREDQSASQRKLMERLIAVEAAPAAPALSAEVTYTIN